MGYDGDENLVAQRPSRLGEDHAVLAAEVDGQVSRQGVGAGSMEAAERWAGDAGCHAVWIRSGEQRTAAHEFHRACGYELLKGQLVLVKTLVEDTHDPRVAHVVVPPSDPNTQ